MVEVPVRQHDSSNGHVSKPRRPEFRSALDLHQDIRRRVQQEPVLPVRRHRHRVLSPRLEPGLPPPPTLTVVTAAVPLGKTASGR